MNYLSARTGKALPFDFIVDGVERNVRLPGSVAVGDADAYVACCAADLGLIQLPRYHVAAQLEEGTLREVLGKWRPLPMPVSVLYPHLPRCRLAGKKEDDIAVSSHRTIPGAASAGWARSSR